MINIKFETKRKKTSWPSSYSHSKYTPPAANDEVGALFKQAKTRDARIKALVKNLSYVEGEYVSPLTQAGRDKWGEQVVVEKICDSYAKMGKDEEWPANNTPFLITAWSDKENTRFFCTPGYLVSLINGKPPEAKQ